MNLREWLCHRGPDNPTDKNDEQYQKYQLQIILQEM
jgi:hypothetical protein